MNKSPEKTKTIRLCASRHYHTPVFSLWLVFGLFTVFADVSFFAFLTQGITVCAWVGVTLHYNAAVDDCTVMKQYSSQSSHMDVMCTESEAFL